MVSFNEWLVAIGTGNITGSTREADKNKRTDQQVAADEKAKWDQDRGYVNNEWSGLLTEYGSDRFDGRAIKTQDPFETMSHQAIYDALQGVKPDEINTKADGWRRLSEDARTAVAEFATGVNQSITEHWNGKSGKSAIDATREFSTAFTKLAASFQMVGHGLDLTQAHLAQAKGSVGKPDNYTIGDKIIDALPGQNIIKGPTHRAQEAESEARLVMTQYYRPGVNEVDGITPILPEPTSTVDKNNSGDPVSNPSSNQPSSPASVNPAGSPDTTDKNPQGDKNKVDNPQSTQPASTDQNTTSDKPTGTTPASTTPAGTTSTDDPSKSRTPSTPTNTPSTTSPGAPSGVPGTPSSTPGPGKSVPAKPATPTPATSAATAARVAAAGRPGAAGFPGMGAGAARGKGDEDGEHKTPDYLVYDRGSDLLGTQPPALPPGGVIGG
ncbi:hypothetical protein [Nocardia brasiliensis]|uniref:PPE domain-containing protein n=1 Tax=Nocardia brasiliensis TaxID=37326 RepID=UPI00366D3CA2